jgi:YVTN family beta-propeller protein
MGHQLNRWLLSKHAQAYAVLSKAEAKPIADLSGIIEEPQESAMCLGCHATGAEAEDWLKDETFHVEDGVQCEKCHGPGSEHVDDVQVAVKMPTQTDCLMCHQEKGSHVAVHSLPVLDVNEALKWIAHPIPEGAVTQTVLGDSTEESPAGSEPKYAGVFACAQCHNSPMMGHQFSRWRLRAHAQAYARLATPEATVIAEQEGIGTNPQEEAACLKCHSTGATESAGSFLPSFTKDEGVGCEACHGAGSEFMHEAVMSDKPAAMAAGLKSITPETCRDCHEDAHGKPFDLEEAMKAIDHSTSSSPNEIARDSTPTYKTPLNLALSPDSQELYVACEASATVIVVDAQRRQKIAEISVGRQPTDVTFSPDGTTAYVSNRFDDTVSVIDVETREVVETVAVGDEPHGVLTDREGKRLYVLNASEDSISVLDTDSLREIKRLSASRAPWSLALSPDGTQIFVTNALSRFIEFRTPSMSEVTVLDSDRETVEDRFVVPASNILQGVDWHPSGRFAVVTLNRTKNLVPMTRLMQGWTITNGLGLVWKNGKVDQVLLDEPHLCFPDPADVAVSPDGRYALVTSSGSDRVAVVDLPKLVAMLEEASEYDREHVFPNHLGKPTEFVVKRIETGRSPRGVLVTPDGKTAFVTNALDDTLTVIDMDKLEPIGEIDLGGPEVITKVRYGERLFHSANVTFRRQFSCHTCHPDGHVDGITYDIEPDGIGVAPVDNRTLRGILDTAPFKWEGTNPSLSRQCGPRLAVFFTRIQPFNPEELSALTNYIATIPRPPNRHRPLGGDLTEAQRRGKKMFERTHTNGGRRIPDLQRCVNCHTPPLYTNRTQQNVGTKMPMDREERFDVPHLNNIYDSAPYLHNGIAETLEEIWTRFNPNDQHGMTNDMTKDQLNDLIEYLKTL